MGAALDLTAWALAGAGLVAAVLLHHRLARVTEAVARACHELRGPLTAARLGLELGPEIRPLPPGRIRAIELELGRAALALDDLSAVRTTGGAARYAAVDLSRLAADEVEAWRPAARVHGATLRLDGPAAPLWVTGERLRLAQAIGNLIANAIEHGGGEVRVRLRRGQSVVRMEVVDDGPGLSRPVERLGDRRWFTWGGRRPERGHGLAIVRGIAAAHGGRLSAAPSDRGARLVLELPARDPATTDLDSLIQL
jgi:signal transduction histidine kinase